MALPSSPYLWLFSLVVAVRSDSAISVPYPVNSTHSPNGTASSSSWLAYPTGSSHVTTASPSLYTTNATYSSNGNFSSTSWPPLSIYPSLADWNSCDTLGTLANSLSCSCQSLYNSLASTYQYTMTWTDSGGILTNTYDDDQISIATIPASVETSTVLAQTFTDLAYVPPPECCDPCYLLAYNVYLLYWPVENKASYMSNSSITDTASVLYTTVSDGFTFTSPSVYVAYQSLEAYSGNCGPFPDVVQGQNNFTIGYPPGALSTYEGNLLDWISEGSMGFPPVSAINYTQLQYQTSPEGIYLSLPDGLDTLDPAFKTCRNFTVAVGDPPRTLGPATAMVPSVTATAPVLAASPGAQVGPALAPSTPVPVLKESNFKVPPLGTPVDPQESTSQESNPQNVGPGSPGDPPLDNPDIAADPDLSLDPSIDTNNGEGHGAVAGSGKGVAEQSSDNNAGSLPAGVEFQNDSDPASPTHGVTENNDDHSIASINGQQVQAAPGGGVVIRTLTVRPGHQMTQDGTRLSIGTNSMVIDGTAYALPTNIDTEPLIVNGQTIAKDSNGGGVVIGTATYSAGTNTQIPEMSLSVGADNVVINGATYTVPEHSDPSSASPPNEIVAGGESIRRAAGGGVWVGSFSIAAGGQATVSGHTISVASSSIVVDRTAFPLAATPLPTDSLLVGGESVGRAADGGVWIGSSSITAGGQATISGHTISIASSSIVVDNTAFPLAATPLPTNAFLVDDKSVSRAADGGVWFDSSSIALGAQSTISGHIISVASSSVIIDGTTFPLPTAPPPLPTTTNALLIDGTSIRRGPDGSVIIGSSSLPLGTLATIAGNVIISVGASSVIVDGTLYPLPTAAGAVLQQQQQGNDEKNAADVRILTLADGELVTIPTGSGGGATTIISGTTFSIPPAGDDKGGGFVVINGKTLLLPTTGTRPTLLTTTTSNTGSEATAIGGLIMSGFGNGSSSAVQFTGGAGDGAMGRRSRGSTLVVIGVELIMMMLTMVMTAIIAL